MVCKKYQAWNVKQRKSNKITDVSKENNEEEFSW